MQILQLPNLTVELLCSNCRSRAKQLINIATTSKTWNLEVVSTKAVVKQRTVTQLSMLAKCGFVSCCPHPTCSNHNSLSPHLHFHCLNFSAAGSSSNAETLFPLWQSLEAPGEGREPRWQHRNGGVHYRGEKSVVAATSEAPLTHRAGLASKTQKI